MTTIASPRPHSSRVSGRTDEAQTLASRERISDMELGIAAVLIGVVVLLATVLVPVVG